MKKKIPTCKYCHKDIIWRKVDHDNYRGYRFIPVDEATGKLHDCRDRYKKSTDVTENSNIENRLLNASKDAVSPCPDCNGAVPDCTGVCLNCGRIIIG